MKLRKFWPVGSYNLGIDLGTSNTLVHVSGKGIAVREPSLVVQHVKTKQVIAVGREAKKMLGKTPINIAAVSPLEHGVISDYDAAQILLNHFIKQVHQFSPLSYLTKPNVVIGIPSGVTEVERRAVWEATLSAGASRCSLIEEPMAAVIGADINIFEPTGVLVVDIGGGTSEIAVISLGGIVVNRTVRVAGIDMDNAIVSYIRLKHGLLLGTRTTEDLKIKIGSVWDKTSSSGKDKIALVRGRDLETGLPKSINVSESEVREAIAPSVNMLVENIIEVIEETPPELTADILEHGILLSGGVANLQGLDRLISSRAKIPVTVVPDPLTSVVRGCAKVLRDKKLLEHVRVTGGLR